MFRKTFTSSSNKKSISVFDSSVVVRFYMIYQYNYNLVGIKEENNLFPMRNYFYFTERQFNWCHLLIFRKTYLHDQAIFIFAYLF